MKLKALLFMLVTALAGPAALAGNIAGVWKHSEEAGWIEIRVVDGVASGKHVRNEEHPELVGREILKDLGENLHDQLQFQGVVKKIINDLGFSDEISSSQENGRQRSTILFAFKGG